MTLERRSRLASWLQPAPLFVWSAMVAAVVLVSVFQAPADDALDATRIQNLPVLEIDHEFTVQVRQLIEQGRGQFASVRPVGADENSGEVVQFLPGATECTIGGSSENPATRLVYRCRFIETNQYDAASRLFFDLVDKTRAGVSQSWSAVSSNLGNGTRSWLFQVSRFGSGVEVSLKPEGFFSTLSAGPLSPSTRWNVELSIFARSAISPLTPTLSTCHPGWPSVVAEHKNQFKNLRGPRYPWDHELYALTTWPTGARECTCTNISGALALR